MPLLSDAPEYPPLLSFFDRIYILNLRSRPDRLEDTFLELERLGVRRTDSRITLVQSDKPTDAGKFPNAGARGCYESHLRALQAIASGKDASALILEDDVDFARQANRRIKDALLAGARDWQMLYPGRFMIPEDSKGPLLPLSREQPVITSHMIGLRRETAAKAEHYLQEMASREKGDERGGPMHVDGAYNHFRHDNPSLLVYAPSAIWGCQRPSASDIAVENRAIRFLNKVGLSGAYRTVVRASARP